MIMISLEAVVLGIDSMFWVVSLVVSSRCSELQLGLSLSGIRRSYNVDEEFIVCWGWCLLSSFDHRQGPPRMLGRCGPFLP